MTNRYCAKTQVPIYHVFSLPTHRPEIDRILRAVSTPVITRTYTIHRKIACSGYVQVDLEYTAYSQEYSQSVHLFSFKIPFAGLVGHRRARSGQEAKVCASIELQAFELIDRRTVTSLLILKLLPLKLEIPQNCSSLQLCQPENIKQIPADHSGCPVFRLRPPES